MSWFRRAQPIAPEPIAPRVYDPHDYEIGPCKRCGVTTDPIRRTDHLCVRRIHGTVWLHDTHDEWWRCTEFRTIRLDRLDGERSHGRAYAICGRVEGRQFPVYLMDNIDVEEAELALQQAVELLSDGGNVPT